MSTDPIQSAVDAVTKPKTIHDLIVDFLQRECGVSSEQYDALYARMAAWGNEQTASAAVNEFSPIMLLEQCRREFDKDVDLVQFALVASDLQWGPRMLKLAQFEKPVWVMALQGFPKMIAEARAAVGK